MKVVKVIQVPCGPDRTKLAASFKDMLVLRLCTYGTEQQQILYGEMMNVCRKFQEKRCNVGELYDAMKFYLRDYADLWNVFLRFMPIGTLTETRSLMYPTPPSDSDDDDSYDSDSSWDDISVEIGRSKRAAESLESVKKRKSSALQSMAVDSEDDRDQKEGENWDEDDSNEIDALSAAVQSAQVGKNKKKQSTGTAEEIAQHHESLPESATATPIEPNKSGNLRSRVRPRRLENLTELCPTVAPKEFIPYFSTTPGRELRSRVKAAAGAACEAALTKSTTTAVKRPFCKKDVDLAVCASMTDCTTISGAPLHTTASSAPVAVSPETAQEHQVVKVKTEYQPMEKPVSGDRSGLDSNNLMSVFQSESPPRKRALLSSVAESKTSPSFQELSLEKLSTEHKYRGRREVSQSNKARGKRAAEPSPGGLESDPLFANRPAGTFHPAVFEAKSSIEASNTVTPNLSNTENINNIDQMGGRAVSLWSDAKHSTHSTPHPTTKSTSHCAPSSTYSQHATSTLRAAKADASESKSVPRRNVVSRDEKCEDFVCRAKSALATGGFTNSNVSEFERILTCYEEVESSRQMHSDKMHDLYAATSTLFRNHPALLQELLSLYPQLFPVDLTESPQTLAKDRQAVKQQHQQDTTKRYETRGSRKTGMQSKVVGVSPASPVSSDEGGKEEGEKEYESLTKSVGVSVSSDSSDDDFDCSDSDGEQ